MKEIFFCLGGGEGEGGLGVVRRLNRSRGLVTHETPMLSQVHSQKASFTCGSVPHAVEVAGTASVTATLGLARTVASINGCSSTYH